jgi:uncharacterized cupin superfamily protein
MPNIHEPHFDQIRDAAEGFHCRRAYVGRQAGCAQLGASLWELPPGQAAYPYHWHVAQEELLFVLAGRPTLRTPEGERGLDPGEVVAFPVGESGAHQMINRTEEAVRFLVVSPVGGAEVCVYPDSAKLGAYGEDPRGGNLRELFRLGDAVDYWEGESPPSA